MRSNQAPFLALLHAMTSLGRIVGAIYLMFDYSPALQLQATLLSCLATALNPCPVTSQSFGYNPYVSDEKWNRRVLHREVHQSNSLDTGICVL